MPATLYYNCRVWQPSGAFTEAFGVRNGHFDFTGSNAEAKKIFSRYPQKVNLNGKLVLPGLTDGHLHLVYGSLMQKKLDCRNVKSIRELKKIVNEYAAKNKNKWIIGSNLNIPKVFGDLAKQTGNVIDKIYSTSPLFITNYDFHSGICNSLCLEKAGLIEKLNIFSSDEILADENGNPVGIIKEAAYEAIYDNLPQPTISEQAKAVKDFIKVLHSFGITTVTDITVTDDLDVYKKLYESRALKIRVNSYIPYEEFSNLARYEEYTNEIDKDFFSIKGFKAFYDGSLGSATGLFSMPYKNTSNFGYRTPEAESGELKEYAMDIDEAGKQIIIHAIGDKAVTEVLDICAEMKKLNGKRDRRVRIEHAQHINKKDFGRFKNLGVLLSVQPKHLKYDIGLVKSVLADEMIETTHNYKILMDTGVTLNFGTDFPIVEINPFENIQFACTRSTGSEVFYPENRIGLHDCIKAYTINNAYSNFNESAAGSVETGKAADFVIMKDDLFEMDKNKLGKARVLKTFIGGKEVYSAK